jgi:hypothetical protein
MTNDELGKTSCFSFTGEPVRQLHKYAGQNKPLKQALSIKKIAILYSESSWISQRPIVIPRNRGLLAISLDQQHLSILNSGSQR